MELLLALVVFGGLGAVTVFGYMSSERGARERMRPEGADYRPDRPMSERSGAAAE